MHDFIINCHVPCANDPGKNNIIMILEKNFTPEKMNFMSILLYQKNSETIYYDKKKTVQSKISTSQFHGSRAG